jgi:hypothetical protein
MGTGRCISIAEAAHIIAAFRSEVYQNIYANLTGKVVLAYNASFDVHSLFRSVSHCLTRLLAAYAFLHPADWKKRSAFSAVTAMVC